MLKATILFVGLVAAAALDCSQVHCDSGKYCRPTCDGLDAECVRFVPLGGDCGGRTECQLSKCDESDGVSCLDLQPDIADEPGKCSTCPQHLATECANDGGQYDVLNCVCTMPDPCQNVICTADRFCRPDCKDPSVAVCEPYLQLGETCGGLMLPCMESRCMWNCVSPDPTIADLPGVCSTCTQEQSDLCLWQGLPFDPKTCGCVDVCEGVDCRGKFCRPQCADMNAHECVAYTKVGGQCGDLVEPCLEQRCRMHLTCIRKVHDRRGECAICIKPILYNIKK